MIGHKYTAEEREFFQVFVPGHSHREIQEAFIARFGWDITTSQIKGYIANHKLNTGRTGRFVKGQEAHNKGAKISPEVYEKVKHTMFSKGHVPANHREVGSTRVNVDGYIEIKVAEPNKWCLLHRHIWQQEYGPVPKGHCLIFKDNDRLHCELDNLMLITRNELKVLNQNGLNKTEAEYKEAALNLARMIYAGTEAKKRKNAAKTAANK